MRILFSYKIVDFDLDPVFLLETLFTALNIPWDVHVPDEYVMSGNAAILRCIVPVHCLDRIDGTDWLTDEDVSVFNYLGKNFRPEYVLTPATL